MKPVAHDETAEEVLYAGDEKRLAEEKHIHRIRPIVISVSRVSPLPGVLGSFLFRWRVLIGWMRVPPRLHLSIVEFVWDRAAGE